MSVEPVDNLRIARFAGVVGSGGLFVYYMISMMLFGLPDDAEAYTINAIATATDTWTIGLVGVMGVSLLVFMLPAIFHLYLALRPAGNAFVLPPILLLLLASFYAVGYHISASFIILRLLEANGEPISQLNTYTELFSTFQARFHAIVAIVFVWFFFLIIYRKTYYPNWIAKANPLFILMGFRAIGWLGIYLKKPWLTAYTNSLYGFLGIAGFVALSTFALWKKRDMKEDSPLLPFFTSFGKKEEKENKETR